MNKYLKIIGEFAGIDDSVIITKTRAGIRTKVKIPKYELIKTHVGRKTFATHAFLEGVPTLSIMKITGHKTETEFLKYVKVSQEENAVSLSNHKFFNT